MDISFNQSHSSLDIYDFLEISAHVSAGAFANPFTEVELHGVFGPEGKSVAGAPRLIPADGFCDAADGSVFRIRFMPTMPGRHTYTVTLKHGSQTWQHTGAFEAQEAGRRGLVRVDREHPWHFIWEGSGEHYYYNSTTAYALMGLRDDGLIQAVVDRLHRLKVNRLRVALNPARVKDGMAWYEPVYPSDEFSFLFGPWVAARPDDLENPGWDVTPFDVAYWQKYERLLAYARQRDVLISVIFHVDGARPGVDPFGKAMMGGEDEQRYYRYAAARLAAFSNVMWDVTNEYHLFRTAGWAERMGAFLRSCDPYRHLTSIHGHETFEFRTAGWADFAMYQSWDEFGGYEFMLNHRREQAATGRPMPQVNEEYGYEDHYPQSWGGARVAPARSSDNRRRLAWEMVMAGGYQTTGEYTANGLGGWINGRGGDDTMLTGNARLMDFITSFEWWKAEPRPDLCAAGTLCLAEPGHLYVLYSCQGADVSANMDAGTYQVQWYNPRNGVWSDPQEIQHPDGWLTLISPDRAGDMAVKLTLRP